jgi:predicted ATP-dependent endonuclease of OLD family
MLYYNNVLLVEGESEKYFYNLLLIKDINFHKYIFEKRFGIFAVNGIAFEMIKKLLEALGVNVFIKTDNDIFKVQNTDETYRYAGLERCIKYLKTQSRSQILVTTHNDGLLDLVDDLIRKDSVWFTEKDKAGVTDLYKLTDFRGVNRLSSIREAYRNKRFGATMK